MSEGLVDRVLAVVAMLVAVRAVMHAFPGRAPSWKRVLVLGAGAVAGPIGTVGLLFLRHRLFDEGPLFVPSLLGAALAAFGGVLGIATLVASRADPSAERRGDDGLTEDQALSQATLASAMLLYVAMPRVALVFLGLTRLGRALLPFTVDRHRTRHLIEGAVMLVLSAVPRDPTLGGLRQLAHELLGG